MYDPKLMRLIRNGASQATTVALIIVSVAIMTGIYYETLPQVSRTPVQTTNATTTTASNPGLAYVSLTAITCSATGKECTISLYNGGGAPGFPPALGVITFAGSSSILETMNSYVVPAGGYLNVNYMFTGQAVAGEQYTGYLGEPNGLQVQFGGTFAT
jgi:hypothetical protein